MRIGRRFGANQDIHLSELACRIEFVAQFPRCGPDKEIGGHALPERLHKNLVVMSLDLKAVWIGDRKGRHGLTKFENSQMIQRGLDVTDLALAGRLRTGRDRTESKKKDRERLHGGLLGRRVSHKKEKRSRARGRSFSFAG